MEKYIIFVDETGPVNSQNKDQVYGYGFFIIKEDNKYIELEEQLNKSFPNGLHMKNERKRKLDRTKKIFTILKNYTNIYAGSMIYSNPSADDSFYKNMISDAILKGDDRIMRYFVNTASSTDGQRILTIDDVPLNTRKKVSMINVYSSVVRIPVFCLLKSIDDPKVISINIKIGKVSDGRQYDSMKDSFLLNLPDYFKLLKKENLINSIPRKLPNMECIDGLNNSILFGLADRFAGIGYHYYQYTQDKEKTTGLELYNIMKPILEKSPPYGRFEPIVPGIFIYNLPDN